MLSRLFRGEIEALHNARSGLWFGVLLHKTFPNVEIRVKLRSHVPHEPAESALARRRYTPSVRHVNRRAVLLNATSVRHVHSRTVLLDTASIRHVNSRAVLLNAASVRCVYVCAVLLKAARAAPVRPAVDDAVAGVEVLAPVASVRAAIAYAGALRAAPVTATVDAIAGVEVLALITGVCATLTHTPSGVARAAPVRPAVDSEARKVLAPVASVHATLAGARGRPDTRTAPVDSTIAQICEQGTWISMSTEVH